MNEERSRKDNRDEGKTPEKTTKSESQLKQQLDLTKLEYIEDTLNQLRQKLEFYRKLSITALSLSFLGLLILLSILAFAFLYDSYNESLRQLLSLTPLELESVIFTLPALALALFFLRGKLLKDIVWILLLIVIYLLLGGTSFPLKISVSIIALTLSVPIKDPDSSTALALLSFLSAWLIDNDVKWFIIVPLFLIMTIFKRYEHRWIYPGILLAYHANPWTLVGLPLAFLRGTWGGKFLAISLLGLWALTSSYKLIDLPWTLALLMNLLIAFILTSAWHEADLGNTSEVGSETEGLLSDLFKEEQREVVNITYRRIALLLTAFLVGIAFKNVTYSIKDLATLPFLSLKSLIAWLPTLSLLLLTTSFGLLGLILALLLIYTSTWGTNLLTLKVLLATAMAFPRTPLGIANSLIILILTLAQFRGLNLADKIFYVLSGFSAFLFNLKFSFSERTKKRKKP